MRTWHSTIAMKMGMAVTGLIFIGYLLAHMYGNFKLFAGQDAFDAYAHHLRTLGEPFLPYAGLLSVMRVVLVGSLIIHVLFAVILWRRARNARPIGYAAPLRHSSTLASRSMLWGGLTILGYVVFHIGNLTTHTFKTYPSTDSPYERLVYSFQPEHWWVALIYLAALVPLALHIRHGFYSSVQTLGLTGTVQRRALMDRVSITLAVVIPVGFASIPLGVLAGVGT